MSEENKDIIDESTEIRSISDKSIIDNSFTLKELLDHDTAKMFVKALSDSMILSAENSKQDKDIELKELDNECAKQSLYKPVGENPI